MNIGSGLGGIVSSALLAIVSSALLASSAAAQQVGTVHEATPAAAPDAVEARASALAAEMTEAERLAYVHGYFPPMSKDAPADMIPSAGYVPGVPRLGIPTLRESDASLGVANQIEQRKGDVATALPASLALAAGFDPDLAYRTGAMIGAEARAKTFNVLLAGGANLTRDPWGGRAFEYLGEDPLLTGVLAGEHIAGVQSNRIVSTVKHLALNPQETGRHAADGLIGEAALRETDLLAFQIAIERGKPGAVMCAYNKVNGDWACENDFLLNQVLKRDWGYRGWVMSDWGAVHSTVKAVRAGLDQQSGRELDSAMFFGAPLRSAIASGQVASARLEDMARRILWGVVSTGLIDAPVPKAEQPIDYPAHARVAQEAAEAGIVLLKNARVEAREMLPLAAAAKRIVLIGGRADVGVLSGGGSSQVRSVGGVPIEIPLTNRPAASFVRTTWHSSSPLAAIRAMAPSAQVSWVDGRNRVAAAQAASEADLALVFATQWRTEAEDIATLALPDGQDALIDAVAAANRRTVVVLQTGGPVLMPWIGRVPAVVEAWYPGQRGGEAIARVLFGAVNPSGRLPMTFPASDAQAPRPAPVGLATMTAQELDAAANPAVGKERTLPPLPINYREGAAVGYRWYERQGLKPLFPFGHGLSYTRFRYGGLRIEPGETLRVSFDVTNAGRVAGADVPQIYATAGRRDGPTVRLVGFQKVKLEPGETRRVTVAIDPRLLADYDPSQPGWHMAAGRYPIAVGRFAGDQALTGVATLAERRLRP